MRCVAPSTPSRFLTLLLLAVVVTTSQAQEDNGEDWQPRIDERSRSELFNVVESIRVQGPSHFPKPSRLVDPSDKTIEVVVEPAFGEHRPDQDVVMAYAEGYDLPYYMMFMETLRGTGFDGDVVLAIADHPFLAPHVLDYLKTQDNLIVYIHPLHCYESDGRTPSPRRMKNGSMDVFQMCHLGNVYGWKDKNGKVIKKAKDPRTGRVVATLRYEWYWIWAQQYNANSWIMLIDARDSFFQTNPFVDLPRNQNGLLYFFGENAEATRLGISKKNKNWLLRSYGVETMQAMAERPTICSGSTMGEQVAIETYLRAMVNEWDETDIKMTGADQGFHNYLYYSGKLASSSTISKLVVWEQGKGIINNLGALRTKPFVEWGFYNEKTYEVYNWDGELSPVAHQWDRDAHLHNRYVRQLFPAWKKKFLSEHKDD